MAKIEASGAEPPRGRDWLLIGSLVGAGIVSLAGILLFLAPGSFVGAQKVMFEAMTAMAEICRL